MEAYMQQEFGRLESFLLFHSHARLFTLSDTNFICKLLNYIVQSDCWYIYVYVYVYMQWNAMTNANELHRN